MKIWYLQLDIRNKFNIKINKLIRNGFIIFYLSANVPEKNWPTLKALCLKISPISSPTTLTLQRSIFTRGKRARRSLLIELVIRRRPHFRVISRMKTFPQQRLSGIDKMMIITFSTLLGHCIRIKPAKRLLINHLIRGSLKFSHPTPTQTTQHPLTGTNQYPQLTQRIQHRLTPMRHLLTAIRHTKEW